MIPWWTRIGIMIAGGLIIWLLVGCAPSDEDEDDKDAKAEPLLTVEEMYSKGLNEFTASDYTEARDTFEEVERQYPYSEWAKRAQIMAAYAAYRDLSYDEATMILERFVKLYPNDERTPYAYYLRALCYYDQIVDIGRDQKTTQQAQQSLREVVSRFPDTDYARDAKIKLDLTQDHLAGKEMQIGRYYLDREEYLSAANRFRYVVTHYQTTSHIPEALHRLVETYLQLGVKPEAQKYAAVLGYNYPGSEWYGYSYAMLNGDVDPEKASGEGIWGDLIPGL